MCYFDVPTPIDTSNIVLSDELCQLGELLAENTHNNYVQLRLKQGWMYGPMRDDIKKTNPTLIRYDQLTEDEKEYDRQISAEVLKMLIAMGYQIVNVTE